MNWRKLGKILWLFAALGLTIPASAYDPIDRTRPASAVQLQLQPPSTKLIDPDADQQPSSRKRDDLDLSVAKYIKLEDCPAIIRSVPSRDYENTPAETLAIIATCEPPGKDPEKIFSYAEKKTPASDMILLLHARYAWKKQSPHAFELFQQLNSQTKDPQLSELSAQYLPEPPRPVHAASAFGYVLTAQIGGIEETNPPGVPISAPNDGNYVSTAGVAQIGATVRKAVENYNLGFDAIANDTTYWLTHDVDMLNDDVDIVLERRIGGSQKIGLRPFGSFYLLAGARYYSAVGLGLTYSVVSENADQWMQISNYQDSFWLQSESAQSATHERADWQIFLKQYPTLTPAVLVYVDYAAAGASTVNGNYIPYSHTEFGLAAAFSRTVHRYSVGVSLRTAFRVDSQQTVLNDQFGNTIAKTRNDFQVAIRPNLTIPLAKGLDLYMYFESNSIASNLIRSDGLDRNISDNLIGAVLRVSVANF